MRRVTRIDACVVYRDTTLKKIIAPTEAKEEYGSCHDRPAEVDSGRTGARGVCCL
jgi:hypothetical protein